MEQADRETLEILGRATASTRGRLAYSLEHYLEAAALLEQLPRNRTGQDKSWVWSLEQVEREYFAGVRRIDGSDE